MPEWQVVVMALAPTLAVCVSWWLTNRNSERRTRETSVKLDKISRDTNGTLSTARADIDRLEHRLYEVTGESPDRGVHDDQ